ncbi:bifunctional glutamine synthetase adenylyltransferase/deadenyltransferase [Rodentibacter pneumotropicus]|uniref:Bifunctional glutamine synthetase adenylyltransferase/adenylyl-removing enzyme n=1 Tax=Rodentibacter pneumotropicus TaxID=758 RepID=A0AAW5LD14_9PAST|nr:bifunctional [glutamate--ammonia ligase]-adenylyl-L-tyrosine phosphorylase/[glutamate--ammonia-ligase] adenylyltransferase [Rodentibacter pneumotropicus]MCQ9121433.1 bifunctional [glutamate--ammonia ligase]-adenylyl-L-tyrosine phosphorylase/[glutamate--ammonia-ligase] adenylyltransferase [Rodentibacter pneumotropicus]OOF66088.1 bifunctional glutamine synthetase adenylyltransferase/deadenyltransferase [Rodentibacter pneumotropicus]
MTALSSLIEQKLTVLGTIMCQSFPDMDANAISQQIKQYQKDKSHPIGGLGYAVAMSDFVEKVLQKQPHLLAQWWKKSPTFADCEQYSARLNNQLSDIFHEAEFYKALRVFRNIEMAKLSFCQSLNLASVEEIFIRLSLLAEGLIIAARDWLYHKACTEMGTPLDEQGKPQQLYILGMGKLGGFELNFSSDIDLIFTYPAQGETHIEGSNARKPVDNAKFFTRLGQRLISALDDFTADGFVYRTDMRLRPFGESGALALSFSAMEQYYQDQGRDWERYAMIKGRILGGQTHDPNVTYLEKMLPPFVYRRYIDFSVLQSLREMKGKIEREVRRRGLKDNIKLGAGGIREVEFIAQVFQLIRGGREIALQQHSLLKILPEITKLGLITQTQYQNLRESYVFLRRVENILQAINDQQTQTLPTNETDQLRLIEACRHFTCLDEQNHLIECSYAIQNWQDFYRTLQQMQENVRAVFNQLIGEENNECREENQWLDFLEADFDEIEQMLQESGIQSDDVDGILNKLGQFKESLNRRAIGQRGREVLAQLMPTVFSLIFNQESYRTLLARILHLIEKISSRTTYLELLLENPQALRQVIELCGKSQLISDQLSQHPILLDELLNTESLRNPLPFTRYADELQQYLLRLPPNDEEQFINALRQFKQATLLRVAAADILGALPVMKVSDHLTYLAEAIIQSVVNLAWKQVSTRFGIPQHLQNGEKNFLVVGYGKLGGLELGYKSDLDLVFLYEAVEGQTVGGKKIIDSNQFYLKLAQKIVSIFSLNTSAGVLYDIDMRLRPSGDAGLLGCSLSAFENYQLNEAWTWEKQALVRSRPVFGEQSLREKFENIRQRVLSTPRDMTTLKQDVSEMREKMFAHLSHSQENEFNIKTDRGGITDIEFIAQYLMLAHAPQNPALTKWSDNVRIFESMADAGIIHQEDSVRLKQCYVDLRNKIHHLNLIGYSPVVPKNDFVEKREFIESFWKNLFRIES